MPGPGALLGLHQTLLGQALRPEPSNNELGEQASNLPQLSGGTDSDHRAEACDLRPCARFACSRQASNLGNAGLDCFTFSFYSVNVS